MLNEIGSYHRCKKEVASGSVPIAWNGAGILSLSCYCLPNPASPKSVSCFLGRLIVLFLLLKIPQYPEQM